MAFWQVLGSLNLAASVGGGAYGAHGLASSLQQRHITPASPTASPTDVWSRAVHYQQLHGIGLVLTPFVTNPGSVLRGLAGVSFTTGIVLFSGGLYASTWTGDKQLAKGAPFGGLAFIGGWLTLALAAATAGARRGNGGVGAASAAAAAAVRRSSSI